MKAKYVTGNPLAIASHCWEELTNSPEAYQHVTDTLLEAAGQYCVGQGCADPGLPALRKLIEFAWKEGFSFCLEAYESGAIRQIGRTN